MEVLGPGIWHVLHKLGLEAQDENEITCYIWMVYRTIETLDCSCKHHAIEYAQNNPPELFRNIIDDEGKQIGMFLWSFLFHNNVNLRLNKPLLNFDQAYSLWSGSGKSGGSGGSDEKEEKHTVCLTS